MTALVPIDVDGIRIASWCPTPDASGPPTQVHVVIDIDAETSMVLRFKSPRGLSRFIKTLCDHGQEVWPEYADPELFDGGRS